MPVGFSKAGTRCAHAMAGYLGDRVYMVSDVHVELERLSRRLPALAKLLKNWPSNAVRELDLSLKVEVAEAVKARYVPGQHPDEDRGEIATIFYAADRRDAGEHFKIVTDDSFGKQLARDRKLKLLTTAELTLEMVQAEAISHADGKRVWRQCVSKRGWKDFDGALARKIASA